MRKVMSKIQFLWDGKADALNECNTPQKYIYELPETIGNEIHCVDNLDFLKNNKERLAGKVKCIYIDPPYNTGNDFIYNDKRHKGRECRHSNWLSFMYPRLVLARELLREDGVIFISIDDNEVHHLRQIMNEIFGEEEFVASFIWRKKRGGGRGNSIVIPQTEYILCYSKNIQEIKPFQKDLSEHKLSNYKYEDSFGKYAREGLDHHTPYGEYERKTLQYDLTIDDKIIHCPTGQWLWSKDRVNQELENFIINSQGKKEYKYLDIVLNSKNEWRAYKKIRLESDGDIRQETALSIIDDSSMTTNASAFEIKEIFNGDGMFDYPKPVSLIKHLLQISTKPNDLILDFFAGSGTTGQAVMELNQEEVDKSAKDGLLADKTAVAGGRKFILVQLPEKIDDKKEAFKAGYKHISDITIERVKRAGEKYKNTDTNFKIYHYE